MKQQNRTIVRDPRKTKLPSNTSSAVDSINVTNTNLVTRSSDNTNPIVTHHQQQNPPLPFAPTEQNQQSVGSMVGSYMLAGFGMGLGMVLVRIILGG
jgi:Flp pilus assembly protein TadG